MDLYKISLSDQTIEVSDREKAKLVSTFTQYGIKYNVCRVFDDDSGGVLLKDLVLSVRARNVLDVFLFHCGFRFDDTTLEQFTRHFSQLDLLKQRNCGERTINEIKDIAIEHGIEWRYK